MALAVDNSAAGVGSSVNSVSFALNVSGSNRHLRVGVGYYDNSSAINTVTYNSVACSSIASSTATNGALVSRLYSLIAPDTGNNNVVVTFNGVGDPLDIGIGAVSFTDAHQTTPNGTPATATGSGSAPTVNVSSAADEIVHDHVFMEFTGGGLTPGANQTQRYDPGTSGGFGQCAGSTETGAATTTMSWGESGVWATTACAVKPAAAATLPHLLMLLGAGR